MSIEKRDPLSPQWEDCKVCGGDHWTKDHPRSPDSPPEPPSLDVERLEQALIRVALANDEEDDPNDGDLVAIALEPGPPSEMAAAIAREYGGSPPPPDLSELRTLSEAATPGEWVGDEGRPYNGGTDPIDEGEWPSFSIPSPDPNSGRLWWQHSIFSDSPMADAAFIVAAVNYVRSLLASQPPSTPRETP